MSADEATIESREAESARLALENRELRGLLQRVPMGVMVKDRDSTFLYANEAAAAGYGVSAAQLIGKNEREVLPPGNDLQAIMAGDRDVIDSGEARSVPQLSFTSHDGNRLSLLVLSYPVVFAGIPAVMVAVLDISDYARWTQERDELEQRVVESQRLESLGLMAGGIAHDFNNLLVGVFAHAELALGQLPPDSPAAPHIESLRSAADRLGELSRQMLAYSGRGHVQSEPVDVAQLARELLGLMRASTPANVALETSLARGLPLVSADPSQLNQVLMNMVTNAAEAMGETRGTVRVAVRSEHFDSSCRTDLAFRSVREPGQYVCLEVSDDGPGMDAHTREHLFDPFFTTKGPGRGLGLASVLGIARSHGGALLVKSAPGEGTLMRLWLPPARRQSPPVAEASGPQVAGAAGTRVLVVDDEPLVREATAALLETRGFRVQTAEDGDDALARAAQEGFNVVLLDMTMPGPPSRDVHSGLRRLHPALPILLTSGFSEPGVLKELVARPATAFIAKPFSADELVEQLRALLV